MVFFFSSSPSLLSEDHNEFYCSSKTDFQELQWSPWYRPPHETAAVFSGATPTTAIHLCENTVKLGGGLHCRVCNFHGSGQKLWCLLFEGVRIVVEAHLPNLMCFFDLLSISSIAKTKCGVTPIFFEKRKERLFFSWNFWKALLYYVLRVLRLLKLIYRVLEEYVVVLRKENSWRFKREWESNSVFSMTVWGSAGHEIADWTCSGQAVMPWNDT